jgi:hypothetical protein
VNPPATLAEERRLWQALGQTMYRRGTTDELESLLRFRTDP